MRVQEPVDVVVGAEQEAGGVGPGRILGDPLRRYVTVRGDDRQVLDRLVQTARDVSGGGLSGEEAVGVKRQRWHVLIFAWQHSAAATLQKIARCTVESDTGGSVTTPIPLEVIGGAHQHLSDSELTDFVNRNVAPLPLDGKDVVLVVPDGTTSLPSRGSGATLRFTKSV